MQHEYKIDITGGVGRGGGGIGRSKSEAQPAERGIARWVSEVFQGKSTSEKQETAVQRQTYR